MNPNVAPLAAGCAGFTFGIFDAPDHASKEFWVAASGLVPILLLTVGLQLRLMSNRIHLEGSDRALVSLYGGMTLLGLTFAEADALGVLAEASYKSAVAWFTYGAMFGGLAVITTAALLPRSDGDD